MLSSSAHLTLKIIDFLINTTIYCLEKNFALKNQVKSFSVIDVYGFEKWISISLTVHRFVMGLHGGGALLQLVLVGLIAICVIFQSKNRLILQKKLHGVEGQLAHHRMLSL